MQGYCVIISNYRKNWPRLGIRDPEASRVLHLPASGAASPKASSPPATSTSPSMHIYVVKAIAVMLKRGESACARNLSGIYQVQ